MVSVVQVDCDCTKHNTELETFDYDVIDGTVTHYILKDYWAKKRSDCTHTRCVDPAVTFMCEKQAFDVKDLRTIFFNFSGNDIGESEVPLRYLLVRMHLLVELDVSGNAIEQLNKDTFKKNPLLERIWLQNNRVNRLNGCFQSLPKLLYVNLADHDLGVLLNVDLPVVERNLSVQVGTADSYCNCDMVWAFDIYASFAGSLHAYRDCPDLDFNVSCLFDARGCQDYYRDFQVSMKNNCDNGWCCVVSDLYL